MWLRNILSSYSSLSVSLMYQQEQQQLYNFFSSASATDAFVHSSPSSSSSSSFSFPSSSLPSFSSSFLSDKATVLKTPFHILLPSSFSGSSFYLGFLLSPTSIKIQQHPELQTFPGSTVPSPLPPLHHKILPTLDPVDSVASPRLESIMD